MTRDAKDATRAAGATRATDAAGTTRATRAEGAAGSLVVEVSNLVKRYKETIALDHFNLSIEPGEVFGLLGPNGSGKTTAINCILQLLTYDKGEVRLFGEAMAPTRYDLKSRIGVVPQNLAVFEELTVRENIDYFCALYVPDKGRRRALVDEAIRFVGLEGYERFRPKKLSGGLARRLNIACGIAHKPELIILDEPTVAVDPQSRNAILEGILRLNAEGSTIIYTSHYMEEVEEICSRIMIMDKGRGVACGTNSELKAMIGTGEKLRIQLAGAGAAGLSADADANVSRETFVSSAGTAAAGMAGAGLPAAAAAVDPSAGTAAAGAAMGAGAAAGLPAGAAGAAAVDPAAGTAAAGAAMGLPAGAAGADADAAVPTAPAHADLLARVRELPHTLRAELEGDVLAVDCTAGAHNLADVLDLLSAQGIAFGRIYAEPPTLNDVFLEITGTELRD
nr:MULTISPECIES: ABC transporter ATP-binding protein [unclassified Adlercreutzia]